MGRSGHSSMIALLAECADRQRASALAVARIVALSANRCNGPVNNRRFSKFKSILEGGVVGAEVESDRTPRRLSMR